MNIYTNTQQKLQERFIKYVKIDTQSNPESKTCPSTLKQKNLGQTLVAELLEMRLADAHIDDNGYVYATIPSNTKKQCQFCASAHTWIPLQIVVE